MDDERTEHGVMIECDSKILDSDKAQSLKEYKMKVKGWQNNETTAVIELRPRRKASRFLK